MSQNTQDTKSIPELESRIEFLEKALGIYANPDNWVGGDGDAEWRGPGDGPDLALGAMNGTINPLSIDDWI